MTSRGGTYLGSIYVVVADHSCHCGNDHHCVEFRAVGTRKQRKGVITSPHILADHLTMGGGLKAHHTTCPPSGFSDLPTALADSSCSAIVFLLGVMRDTYSTSFHHY